MNNCDLSQLYLHFFFLKGRILMHVEPKYTIFVAFIRTYRLGKRANEHA